MTNLIKITPAIVSCLIFFCHYGTLAQEAPKGNESLKELKYYEFEDLAIKVKIQEPDVLFILDKPNILVEPFDENLNFLGKIDDPLIEEDLF